MFDNVDINQLFGPVAGGGALIFARFYLNKVLKDLESVVISMSLVQKDIAVFAEKFKHQDRIEKKVTENETKISVLDRKIMEGETKLMVLERSIFLTKNDSTV